tara:strand:+ start:125 stop:547 length:423 start_codon:yes stop_codon:yes gene_type:complete
LNTKNKNNRSSYKFCVKMNTRWRDLDSFQHVNNAVFATYIENARSTLFDRWKIRYDGIGKSLILVSLKIDYKKEMLHPSSFSIYQKISRIGNTSFDIESAIFIDSIDIPIAVSTATCVCYDFSNKTPVKVFKEIIDDFNI